MDFVKSLSMFHVDAKEIPCVTGEGTPTMKTEGAPGVLYMDTDTGALYKCRAADYVNGVFTWEAVEAGGSSDEPITLTDNEGLKIGPEGQTLNQEGSVNHIISQSIPVSAGERYRLTCSANFGNSLYAIYSGEADRANLLENLTADATQEGNEIIAQEVVMPTGAQCMMVAWNKLVTDTPYAVVRVSQSAQTTLPLAGQTVVVIGDSIVERNNKTSVNFCDHLAVNTGAEIVNMGVGGTGYMAGQDEEQAFYQRAAEIPDGVDRVLIYGSGNDRNMTLGESTDTGTDTLCGCVNATLDVVFDRAPTAWVGVIAPAPWKDYPPFEEGNAMEKIAGALAAICRRRGVPYLDLYHSSGLRPWDEAFRTLAYSKDDGDGTHPDETGHAMIAPQIQAFLMGAVGGAAASVFVEGVGSDGVGIETITIEEV